MRPTLVLLPGLLCDRALWEPQIRRFGDRIDCRVADLTGADSMADLARSVLESAPERFALAGLSMGGYVALEMLRHAPERVERLALLDTSARPDTGDQLKRRRGLLALSRRGRFQGVTPRLLPLLIHPERLEEADLTAIVTGMAERIGRDAFVRQQTAIMGRIDSRPHLGRIACPTLVVCGRQDALTPLELSEELAGSIAGARLAVVEQCGHLSTLERPEAVNEALAAWLAPALAPNWS
jgi:pimeloyl-ACP methyl ester carboxylesterase